MAGLKCPLCGRPMQGWKEREYQAYHFGMQPMSMPAGTEWERREPARAPTLQGDVAVPALQTVISGVISGVTFGALAMILDSSRPLVVGFIAAGTTWGAAWLFLLRDNRRLLWKVETIAGMDIDQDGEIGEPDDEEPEPQNIVIEIEERRRRGLSLRFVHLPCTEAQLQALVSGIMNGASWAETAWTGRGKPFSRRKFADVREGLVDKGLVQWVNPDAHAQGLELTPAGRAVFKRIAEASGSPTPERARAQAG